MPQGERALAEEAPSQGEDTSTTFAPTSIRYCDRHAYFFKHPGFRGVAMLARRRDVCLNVLPELAGQISSYRIGSCDVKLYREEDCRGFMYTARAGSSWPSLPPEKDDKIRSIWIR